MKTVTITVEALDSMQAQYNDLKRRYALLAALYAWTNGQRLAAEEEVNRLLGLGQGSWMALWEENSHLYGVISDLAEELLDSH